MIFSYSTFDHVELLGEGLLLGALGADLPLQVLGVLLGVQEVIQHGLEGIHNSIEFT